MKNLLLLASLVGVSLGFSSCCSMFGSSGQYAGYRTETRQVKTCYYDTVTKEVRVGDGKDGMVQTVEEKVPRYKTVTKRVGIKRTACVRHYCPKKDACGTTSESTRQMASAQGSVGSPNIGLIPTMKPIAP
ncbi:MAG: hypothetical protein V4584_01465 [Verrucomicrobiota bacterium]